MTLPFRALIVEDDGSWQQILGEILTDAGLNIDTARNLEQAFLHIKAEPHRLAIVDLSLVEGDHNNTDGLRVLDTIRQTDPGCRTILLTGFATVELAVSALTEFGAFTFLRKETFRRSDFRNLIARSLINVPAPVQAQTDPVPVAEPDTDAAHVPLHQRDQALVVEDDAGWRNILTEILTDAGLQVLPCSSFGEALGYLRREKFSLAVVDLSLTPETVNPGEIPGGPLEGYQLLEQAKETNIPAIVVSGIASVEEIQRAYAEHSIYAYLEKQAFNRSAFRRLVDHVLASRHSLTRLDLLTERERAVFDLMARGMTNKEIAQALFITNNTVKRHLKAIFEKLEVHTRAAASAKAFTDLG
jgi:DNA-binding NarL/FixJ family response regulator